MSKKRDNSLYNAENRLIFKKPSGGKKPAPQFGGGEVGSSESRPDGVIDTYEKQGIEHKVNIMRQAIDVEKKTLPVRQIVEKLEHRYPKMKERRNMSLFLALILDRNKGKDLDPHNFAKLKYSGAQKKVLAEYLDVEKQRKKDLEDFTRYREALKPELKKSLDDLKQKQAAKVLDNFPTNTEIQKGDLVSIDTELGKLAAVDLKKIVDVDKQHKALSEKDSSPLAKANEALSKLAEAKGKEKDKAKVKKYSEIIVYAKLQKKTLEQYQKLFEYQRAILIAEQQAKAKPAKVKGVDITSTADSFKERFTTDKTKQKISREKQQENINLALQIFTDAVEVVDEELPFRAHPKLRQYLIYIGFNHGKDALKQVANSSEFSRLNEVVADDALAEIEMKKLRTRTKQIEEDRMPDAEYTKEKVQEDITNYRKDLALLERRWAVIQNTVLRVAGGNALIRNGLIKRHLAASSPIADYETTILGGYSALVTTVENQIDVFASPDQNAKHLAKKSLYERWLMIQEDRRAMNRILELHFGGTRGNLRITNPNAAATVLAGGQITLQGVSYDKFRTNTDIYYHGIELAEKGFEHTMRVVGIDVVTGFYQAYFEKYRGQAGFTGDLEAWKTNPQQAAPLLADILPPSPRKAWLISMLQLDLKQMSKKGLSPDKLKTLTKAHNDAKEIMTNIIKYLQRKDQIVEDTREKLKDYESVLEGEPGGNMMRAIEKIMEGPLHVKLAAGALAIYAAMWLWKDGKFSRLARMGVGVGLLSMVAKQVTGKGVPDWLGMDMKLGPFEWRGEAKAMEGTTMQAFMTKHNLDQVSHRKTLKELFKGDNITMSDVIEEWRTARQEGRTMDPENLNIFREDIDDSESDDPARRALTQIVTEFLTEYAAKHDLPSRTPQAGANEIMKRYVKTKDHDERVKRGEKTFKDFLPPALAAKVEAGEEVSFLEVFTDTVSIRDVFRDLETSKGIGDSFLKFVDSTIESIGYYYNEAVTEVTPWIQDQADHLQEFVERNVIPKTVEGARATGRFIAWVYEEYAKPGAGWTYKKAKRLIEIGWFKTKEGHALAEELLAVYWYGEKRADMEQKDWASAARRKQLLEKRFPFNGALLDKVAQKPGDVHEHKNKKGAAIHSLFVLGEGDPGPAEDNYESEAEMKRDAEKLAIQDAREKMLKHIMNNLGKYTVLNIDPLTGKKYFKEVADKKVIVPPATIPMRLPANLTLDVFFVRHTALQTRLGLKPLTKKQVKEVLADPNKKKLFVRRTLKALLEHPNFFELGGHVTIKKTNQVKRFYRLTLPHTKEFAERLHDPNTPHYIENVDQEPYKKGKAYHLLREGIKNGEADSIIQSLSRLTANWLSENDFKFHEEYTWHETLETFKKDKGFLREKDMKMFCEKVVDPYFEGRADATEGRVVAAIFGKDWTNEIMLYNSTVKSDPEKQIWTYKVLTKHAEDQLRSKLGTSRTLDDVDDYYIAFMSDEVSGREKIVESTKTIQTRFIALLTTDNFRTLKIDKADVKSLSLENMKKAENDALIEAKAKVPAGQKLDRTKYADELQDIRLRYVRAELRFALKFPKIDDPTKIAGLTPAKKKKQAEQEWQLIADLYIRWHRRTEDIRDGKFESSNSSETVDGLKANMDRFVAILGPSLSLSPADYDEIRSRIAKTTTKGERILLMEELKLRMLYDKSWYDGVTPLRSSKSLKEWEDKTSAQLGAEFKQLLEGMKLRFDWDLDTGGAGLKNFEGIVGKDIDARIQAIPAAERKANEKMVNAYRSYLYLRASETVMRMLLYSAGWTTPALQYKSLTASGVFIWGPAITTPEIGHYARYRDEFGAVMNFKNFKKYYKESIK